MKKYLLIVSLICVFTIDLFAVGCPGCSGWGGVILLTNKRYFVTKYHANGIVENVYTVNLSKPFLLYGECKVFFNYPDDNSEPDYEVLGENEHISLPAGTYYVKARTSYANRFNTYCAGGVNATAYFRDASGDFKIPLREDLEEGSELRLKQNEIVKVVFSFAKGDYISKGDVSISIPGGAYIYKDENCSTQISNLSVNVENPDLNPDLAPLIKKGEIALYVKFGGLDGRISTSYYYLADNGHVEADSDFISTTKSTDPDVTAFIRDCYVPETEEDNPEKVAISKYEPLTIKLSHGKTSGTLKFYAENFDSSKVTLNPYMRIFAISEIPSSVSTTSVISYLADYGEQWFTINPKVPDLSKGESDYYISNGQIKLEHINADGVKLEDKVNFKIKPGVLNITGYRENGTEVSNIEEEDDPKELIASEMFKVELESGGILSGKLIFSASNKVKVFASDKTTELPSVLEYDFANPDPNSPLKPFAQEEKVTLYLKPIIVGEGEATISYHNTPYSDTLKFTCDLAGVNLEVNPVISGTQTIVDDSEEEIALNEKNPAYFVGKEFYIKLEPGEVTTGSISFDIPGNAEIFHVFDSENQPVSLPLIVNLEGNHPSQLTLQSQLDAFKNSFLIGSPVTLKFVSRTPAKYVTAVISSDAVWGVNEGLDRRLLDDSTISDDNNNKGCDIVAFEVDIKKVDIEGIMPSGKSVVDNENDTEPDGDATPDPEENSEKFEIMASDDKKSFNDRKIHFAQLVLKSRDIKEGKIKFTVTPRDAVIIFDSQGRELTDKELEVNLDAQVVVGPLAGLQNGGSVTLKLKAIRAADKVTARLTSSVRASNSSDNQDILNFKIASFCPCVTCIAGDTQFSTSSIRGTINLGAFDYGVPAGIIKYYSKYLNESCASPNNLQIIAGGETIFINDLNEIPTSPVSDMRIIYYSDSYNATPELKGFPHSINTTVNRVDFSYQIESGIVKKLTMDFIRLKDNVLFRKIEMHNNYNVDGSFKIDNTFAGYTQTFLFTKDAQGNIVLNDDGIEHSVTEETIDQTIIKRYYTGPQNNYSYLLVEKYQIFPWGTELIESTDSETTTYEYYTDSLNNGVLYGQLKKITYPKGNSTTYIYDGNGNLIESISDEGGNQYKTKTFRYEIAKINNIVNTYAVDLATGKCNYVINATDTYSLIGRKEINIKYCNETLISKSESITYYDYSYAPDEYSVYDQSDNKFTTYTYKISDANSDFFGNVRLVKNYNGTVSKTEYSKNADGSVEIATTWSGVPGDSSDNPTVTQGTKTVTHTTKSGASIYSATWDIASNTKLSEQTAITFDDFGRVTKTQYMDGTFSERTYGCCGVESEKDRNGTVTTYAYNNATKRLSYSVRDGITTLYTYNDNGDTLSVTVKGRNNSELVSHSTYTNGVLATSTDPVGNVTNYTNNGDTVTYPNGVTQITDYNQGVVSSTSGTAVHPVSYTYGPNWQKTMPADVTTYTDFLGRQYKTVYADNNFNETSYNDKGQVIKQVSPGGRISLLEYDALGRTVKSAVDMNLNSVIDDGDIITEYAYSYGTRDSKAVSVTTTTRKQGTNSKVLSVTETSVDGHHSWVTVDGRINYSKTEILGNGQTKITSQLFIGTDPKDKTVTHSLNGRVTLVEKFNNDGSAGNTLEYVYDEFNRVSSVDEKYNGQTVNLTTYTYDNNGQQTSVIVNGRTTSFEYDNMGRRIKTTLPGSRVINYEYHPTGELKKVYGADTYTQEYTYNDFGSMATLKTFRSAENADTTTWGYNNRQFMTSKTYADGKSVSYGYNPDGQPTSRTWNRGIVTTYIYDNAGRQTTVDYSDATPDVTFSYDYLGRVTSVTDGTGTRTFTYNADSTLASVSVPHILSGMMEYGYDALGRRTSMQLKQSSTVKTNTAYAYDVMSRLATVSDGVNTATYAYKPGLDLLNTTTIANASGTLLTATRSYDSYYRLTSVSSATGGATPLTRAYSYVYNDKDQRTKLTLADGTYWLYTYDAKGQVTSGKKYNSAGHEISGQSFGYNYDDIGNLVYEKRGIEDMKIDYTANNVNQYTKRTIPGVAPVIGEAGTDITVKAIRTDKRDPDMESVITMTRSGRYFKGAFHGVDNVSAAKEVTYTVYALKDDPATSKQLIRKVNGSYTVPKRNQLYTYDTDGNMLTNGVWTYTWNGENRLIVAEKSDQKLEFAYDYQGRRVSKKVYTGSAGNWTLVSEKKFVYDGYLQIAEYDASNVLQRSYTWLGGSPGWIKDGANYYYYIIDGNKNVRSMVDASGNEVASYDYNPFGTVARTGSYQGNPFQFSSEYHDNETGLVYYNYRYYSPDLGRWINRDPIEEEGGANLYGMLGNNTIDKKDKLGLKIEGPFYIGGYVYYHVYENLSWYQFFSVPKYLGSVKSKIINDSGNAYLSSTDWAKIAARHIEQKSNLKLLAKNLNDASECLEIAIRIAYDPVDNAFSAVEFIQEPSWVSATGFLPLVPGVIKKIGKKSRGLWKVNRYSKVASWKKGKLYYDPKTKLWWTKDTAGHGGSAWKVYEEKGSHLEWRADVDAYGDFMEKKHKGPVGERIAKKDLNFY